MYQLLSSTATIHSRCVRLCAACVGAPRGKIKLQTEEVADSKFSIALQLSASKLDKKDFFGKVSKLIPSTITTNYGGHFRLWGPLV